MLVMPTAARSQGLVQFESSRVTHYPLELVDMSTCPFHSVAGDVHIAEPLQPAMRNTAFSNCGRLQAVRADHHFLLTPLSNPVLTFFSQNNFQRILNLSSLADWLKM